MGCWQRLFESMIARSFFTASLACAVASAMGAVAQDVEFFESKVFRRRVPFALTGLPPASHEPNSSHETHGEALLSRPHVGEHFARHWMALVRYTDTYGYQWGNPAKGSHEYRDYLIRALYDDIGFDHLVREQLAGDLLPMQRIHATAQTNESLIGPMFS